MAIAVLYEHPEWFKPLFASLERRGLAWLPDRRRRAGVGSHAPPWLRPAGQPHEPVGVDARPCACHPIHAGLSPLRRALGHPHRQRAGRLAARDLQVRAAGSVRTARCALSPRAGHQPPVTGSGGGGRLAVPDRREAQHRRQRSGHPAIRCARRAPARGRGRHGGAGDGRHRAGAGVSAGRGRPHHPARNPAARAALRHPDHPAQGPRLQPVPGRHLPGRRTIRSPSAVRGRVRGLSRQAGHAD